MYLLAEFYRISSSVRMEYRDYTMQSAVRRLEGEWSNVWAQFESLDPPDFIPMPSNCLVSNP